MYIVKNLLIVFKICGACPVEYFGRQNWLYSTCVYVYLIIYNVLMGINLSSASYDEFIETLNALVVSSFVVLQIILLRMNHKKLLQILQIMKTIEAKYLFDTDLDILKKTYKSATLLQVILTSIYLMAVTFAFLTAIFDSSDMLVFPSYFPYDYSSKNRPIVVYYCTILYQYSLAVFNSFACAALNSYGPVLYAILTTYIRLLGMQIKHIGWRAQKHNSKVNNNENEIYSCAQFYELCLSFSEAINNILEVQYFFQILISGILLCFTAYKISLNPPNIIFFLQLYLSFSLQILLPCYYGSLLTNESEQLCNMVYGSNWVDQSKKFKTSLLIIQQRTMQLIVPKTYKGTIVIGLETFVAIYRAAFSLLSCMQGTRAGN